MIKKAQKKVYDILERECEKWKQKDKATWLQHGDMNTKLFHMYANQRKRINHISQVVDVEGVNCKTPKDISKAFIDYYQKFVHYFSAYRV